MLGIRRWLPGLPPGICSAPAEVGRHFNFCFKPSMSVVGHKRAMEATLEPTSCVFSLAEADAEMRRAPVCSPPLEGCPHFVLGLSLGLSLCVSPSVFLSSCVLLLHPPRLPPLVLFRALLPRANQETDISFNRHIFHAAGQGHLSSL